MHLFAKRFQPLAPAQLGQINDKGARDDLAAQTLNQFDPGLRRAAGGQKIIHNQNLLTRFDRIVMQLDRRAVLDEGFFVALRGEPEEMEVRDQLQPLADALAHFIDERSP